MQMIIESFMASERIRRKKKHKGLSKSKMNMALEAAGKKCALFLISPFLSSSPSYRRYDLWSQAQRSLHRSTEKGRSNLLTFYLLHDQDLFLPSSFLTHSSLSPYPHFHHMLCLLGLSGRYEVRPLSQAGSE